MYLKYCRVFVAFFLIAGTADLASARVYHRHSHRYVARHNGDDGQDLAFGTALGLLGVGIAGATAASNGYGASYPAYGSGHYGYGYYGPGYGYYGY